MDDNVCPKCGYEKADPFQAECPKCGIIYSKYREHKEEVRTEKREKPNITLSFKSKITLFFMIITVAFLFLFPWYRYLNEKKIEIVGEHANSSVNMIRYESSGRSRKKFAYYSFVTKKYQVVDSKYATEKLKQGDVIKVIYDPDSPQDNFPKEARISFLFTLLFSLVAPGIFFGAMWLKYPNFREYVRSKLGD